MNLLIRRLTPADSIAELTGLLHAAYADLAGRGFNSTAVDQSDDVTRERIDGGECYVACDGRLIVGTILFRRRSLGGCPWYERPEVSVINQLGVSPRIQSHGVGRRLMEFAASRARASGAAELALDTAEGAHHLIQWYERLGYRFIEHTQWRGKVYRSVIMSKSLVG